MLRYSRLHTYHYGNAGYGHQISTIHPAATDAKPVPEVVPTPPPSEVPDANLLVHQLLW